MKDKISYYELLGMIKENNIPLNIEVELAHKKRKYTMAIDTDGSFLYYDLVGHEDENFPSYLSECFLEYMMFDKNIRIIDEILTKEEKEYLANVIKPFKDRIRYIIKKRGSSDTTEYIYIMLDNEETFYLPVFEKGKYYKRMEIEKPYRLEYLELL